MKARLIVAGVGLPLLILMLLFLPVGVTAAVVAAICGFAVYELLWATGLLRNVRILVVCALMAGFTCLWSCLGMPGQAMQIAVYLFAAYLFGELLAAKTELNFTLICLAAFAGLGVPYLLSAIIRILAGENGRYLVYAPFVMTMVPDSGAFLVGRKLGRHKLAPAISPHKSTEGVAGGVVSGILAMLLYGFILSRLGFRVNYLYAAVYGLLGSIGSVAGDLVFSTIKRQHGIKDFGHLLPGHGGALDRFDSTTVVAPLAELLLLLIPFAVK